MVPEVPMELRASAACRGAGEHKGTQAVPAEGGSPGRCSDLSHIQSGADSCNGITWNRTLLHFAPDRLLGATLPLGAD